MRTVPLPLLSCVDMLLLNKTKIYIDSNSIHTCNSIISINQNFMLTQTAYIHVTDTTVDPHELS